MNLYYSPHYVGSTLNGVQSNLESARSSINTARDTMGKLAFDMGQITGERDILAYALRDVLSNMNGDLLAVLKRHERAIKLVLP